MKTTKTILIDNKWRDGGSFREVINPATGEVIALQAEATESETIKAIESAYMALEEWQRIPSFERSEFLMRVSKLLSERAENIGKTLAMESGKLLQEAISEVRFAADYFSWFAGEARRLEQMVVVNGRSGGSQMLIKKPIGVVASLTPWNFPVSIQARKIAPALAAGCTVVARPSEHAPLSVVELFRCLIDAGLPKGVANLVTGPASIVTRPILESPLVRLISFTGSTGVGKKIYEKSAGTMKKLTLELGGCAPFIVLEDAELEHTLDQAMLAKFRNCGQSCIAANVFYVHESLYEKFVTGFAERIETLRLGDPLQKDVTLGPLINAERCKAVKELRDRAVASGFEPVISAPPLLKNSALSPDCFFVPELLAVPQYEKIDPDLLRTEIFGPLVLVAGFSDLEQLILNLNQNKMGLAAYVFSRDTAKAVRVASRLEVGITGINEGLPSAANVPMGGVKDSGLGREGGHVGMEEFLEIQYLAMKGNPFSD